MIACVYGVGRDDYLGVVLAFMPRSAGQDPRYDQFVTWLWNSDVDAEGSAMGNGHYMPRLDKSEEDWVRGAWDDFELRSRLLYRQTPEWFEWERNAR